jgi:hypothetical protein
VIRVENDRDSVLFRHGANVESSRNGTSDGSRVIRVVKILSSIELQ